MKHPGQPLVRASHPDIDAVLMEVRMPVMDGRTATRLIHSELGRRDLPALAAAWDEAATRDLGEAITDLKFGAALAQLRRRVSAAVVGGAGARP